MRKFVWLAGAVGLVGLAISAGTAQETSLPMPSSYRAAVQARNPSTPSPTQAEAARQSRAAAAASQAPANSRRGGLSLLGGRGTAPARAATAQADMQRYQRNRSFAAQAAPTTSAAPAAGLSQLTPASGQQREAVTGLRNYGPALFGSAGATTPIASAPATPIPAPAPQVRQNYAGPSAGAAPNSAMVAGGNASAQPAAPLRIPQPASSPARRTFTGQNQDVIRSAAAAVPARSGSGIVPADFVQRPGSTEPIQTVSGSAPALPEFGSAPPAADGPLLPAGPGITQPVPTPDFDATGPDAQPSQVTELRGPAVRPRPSAPAGMNFSSRSPHVQIQWKKHGDINVGQPCEVELVVSNNGDASASQVGVDAWFPATVRLTKTVPEPVSANEFVSWQFDRLDAGEQRSIMIMLIPSERGEITASANVHFTASSAKTFSVDEPMLALSIQGPDKVLLGEPASQIVTVSNPGTGIAQNVVVEVQLPEGLQHPKGNRLKMELGSLSAGESRSVRLTLTAQDGGQQAVRVIAKAGTGLEKINEANVLVLAPSLQLALDGPSVRYVGRDARYTLTATNDGLAVTNNVRAMYLVPDGFEFVQAGRGGKYDARTRTVSWFIGSVAPGDKVEMQLKLKPVQLGDFSHVARVLSEHGASSEAQSVTSIQGTASLMLEVVDLDDPVETGRDTAYEIKVRNDGSKGAQNVGLSVELPPGIEMIAIQGPTEYIAESGLIVFKAMPSLPAGQTATFRIQIKGSEEGNQRVRARLTSDSIQEPLTVEELTRFYAD